MSRCLALLLFGLPWLGAVASDTKPLVSEEEFEQFERKIRPLLSQHCFSCHSAEAKTVHGGLRLDTAAHFLAGGDSGPVVTLDEPEESLLLSSIHYRDLIQMPPKGKLSETEIALLSDWVMRGAPFPPSEDQPTRMEGKIDIEAGRKFWSFQKVQMQPLPRVALTTWPQQRIDAFVLSAMEREGLTPAPPADRTTLIRRVTFDLIGLPPTPDQVRDFLSDDTPDAYPRLIDRLLESPQYGEKWARMWLDMARYTDRTASWLYKNGQPHLYRDWVVQAFNDDMPYDEFVHRQLATDMMPETGPQDLPALGFIGLSPAYWKELKLPCEIIKVIVADEWEEKVDAVSRTFLGLTVACARCHDHKFDPVTSEDYHALAGVFASCRQQERPLISEDLYEPVRLAKKEIKQLEDQIAKLKKESPSEGKPDPKIKAMQLTAKVDEIKSATPWFNTPLASAVSEESIHVVRAGKLPENGTKIEYRDTPQDLPLFTRGNPNRPGPVVPRRFIRVLSDEPEPFVNGSGRLELAHAITTDAASLASRVLVNRIWNAHFGQGIVSTPSNFGQQGDRPTHPELLDDLAARFIADGWSIKTLHRQILLSATWQQSSRHDQKHAAIDPDNRWLSRMNRRKLEFEPWRDAMLASSGQLNREMGGPSITLDDPKNLRRTLYATVHRRDMSTTLQIHDFPDPTAHSPHRSITTTPLQGLFALNDPLFVTLSDSLVRQLKESEDQNAKLDQAYWRLFSRSPTEREREIARRFLNSTNGISAHSAWTRYAHALLVSNEFLFLD